MKIQCSCGAKYSFEITPEQAQQSVKFVCPSCGLDSSAYVTELARQQFGIATSATAPATEIATPPPGVAAAPAPLPPRAAQPAAPLIPQPPVPTAVPTGRLARPVAAPAAAAPTAEGVRMCPKHGRNEATEECMVCHKPICPECMALFGYVCSPLCRQKADLKGIHVPVFAGQKSVMETRKWRKVGMIAGSVALLVVAYVGFMTWYRLFGSAPKVEFAVRFEEPTSSGTSFLAGPDKGQVIFIRGATLARYDIKSQKEIWSATLVDPKDFEAEAHAEIKKMKERQEYLNSYSPDARPLAIPSPENLVKQKARWAAEEMELRVVGQRIWVASPKKVLSYDWDTGKPGEQLALDGGFGGMIERGDELMRLETFPDKDVITHVNLASAKVRSEEILQPSAAKTNATTTLAGAAPGAGKTGGAAGGGGNKPMDARKVEQKMSQLSLPAQIAAPAVLSANRGQDRLQRELNGLDLDEDEFDTGDHFTLIPAKDGYVQFSTRLIERKTVEVQAMKTAPKKSALDGPVSVTASMEVANEILNDMQRDRGGTTELIDESRYQVTLRRADNKSPNEWSTEVVGRPAVFALNSVNVVTAKQKIIVLDKNNKKLWESPLTYNVNASAREGDPKTTGQGPCVERGNTLFVFDQGVLTAFDIKTGNAQWRLPSVGISGIFFDDDGMMYVDSTTASPDSIKFSRQIDVAARNMALIMKIDPNTGKTLWSRETGGGLSYVSGKYLYTVQGSGSNDDEESPYGGSGLETKNNVRIRRLSPKNGNELWEHNQERLPIDVRFDQNLIHLVFKKEVQVLKCGTF